MFIFKAVVLPYPPNVLGLEVAFVFLYGIVEWVRLRQGALLRASTFFYAGLLFSRLACARARARPQSPPPSAPPASRSSPPFARPAQPRAATAWRAWARCCFPCASARPL
jgi:hypothetical protein